jgi:ribosome-associated protein
VVKKMCLLISQGLQKKKARIATKVPKGVKERRLEGKRVRSEVKQGRQKFRSNDY